MSQQFQSPPQPTQQPVQSAPQSSTRKPKQPRKPWQYILIGLVVGAILGYAAHTAPSSTASVTQQTATQSTTASQPTVQPTQAPTSKPTPTHALKWTTVQTFKGTGSKKTGTFSAPGDWKILWTCNPSSFSIAYNVIIEVHSAADASLLDLPVNTTCKAGNTSDSSEEHQGGSVYLDITSEGDWTIQVQELK